MIPLNFLKKTTRRRTRRVRLEPLVSSEWRMPDSVSWPCLGEPFTIVTETVAGNQCSAKLERKNHRLTFTNQNPAEFSTMHLLATKILPKIAKPELARIVEEIASECKFDLPVKFSCRFCRSRWGSWSSDNHMMLNAILIFAEKEVIKSVIVHEFCHRTHPDHSRAFWDMVYRYCPESEYKRSHSVLKTLMTDIDPVWRP